MQTRLLENFSFEESDIDIIIDGIVLKCGQFLIDLRVYEKKQHNEWVHHKTEKKGFFTLDDGYIISTMGLITIEDHKKRINVNHVSLVNTDLTDDLWTYHLHSTV